MKTPAHLVIIETLIPEVLSEESLNHIIYTDWYKIVQPGVGVVLCIDSDAIPCELLELSNLSFPEDVGFNLSQSDISTVNGLDKRWNNAKFYV